MATGALLICFFYPTAVQCSVWLRQNCGNCTAKSKLFRTDRPNLTAIVVLIGIVALILVPFDTIALYAFLSAIVLFLGTNREYFMEMYQFGGFFFGLNANLCHANHCVAASLGQGYARLPSDVQVPVRQIIGRPPGEPRNSRSPSPPD